MEQPLPNLPTFECEADVAEGLEGIAWRELKTRFDDRIERATEKPRKGTLRFRYIGNPFQLTTLQTVQAVYLVRYFRVPRPKALLGDEHFKALLAQIKVVRELAPAEAYQHFYLSAAGSDSSVMNRLKDELAAKTGLRLGDEEGDLLIRVRRATNAEEGWETLVRLTPRPSATRAWRVCNREGALNAAVAQAMIVLSQPAETDVFVNMGCGSGTLLIERAAAGASKSISGYDRDPAAIECAKRNVEAAGYSEQIKLGVENVTDLSIASKSVDVVVGDLPFGQLVGTHEENMTLYPAWLKEAGRITKVGGRGVFISQEVRLMEAVLEESTLWAVNQIIMTSLGGLHPRIWVLERK